MPIWCSDNKCYTALQLVDVRQDYQSWKDAQLISGYIFHLFRATFLQEYSAYWKGETLTLSPASSASPATTVSTGQGVTSDGNATVGHGAMATTSGNPSGNGNGSNAGHSPCKYITLLFYKILKKNWCYYLHS